MGSKHRAFFIYTKILSHVFSAFHFLRFFAIGVKDRENNKHPIVLGQVVLISRLNYLLVEPKKNLKK